MQRRPDWWPRLQQTVSEFEGKPFVWGETDCAHFAAACVAAMTDVDVLGAYRGAYATRLQAVARLRRWRHGDPGTACGALLEAAGATPVDPRFARTGDVGVSGDGVLAVRMPAGFIARTENGRYGIASVEKAWAVAWPN